MHELKQLGAGLLFCRVHVLVAIHDIDVEASLSVRFVSGW